MVTGDHAALGPPLNQPGTICSGAAALPSAHVPSVPSRCTPNTCRLPCFQPYFIADLPVSEHLAACIAILNCQNNPETQILLSPSSCDLQYTHGRAGTRHREPGDSILTSSTQISYIAAS